MNVNLLKLSTEAITENYATKAVGSELHQFYQFMVANNVIQIGVAFIISNQVTLLFKNFMTDIISPIIGKLLGSHEKDFVDHKIEIFRMQFKLGSFILSLLNFWIILIIVFYLVRALPKATVKK